MFAQASSSKGTVSLVMAWFRAEFGTNLVKHEGNCNGLTMLLGSSEVLARFTRDPWFESRSGHVIFS